MYRRLKILLLITLLPGMAFADIGIENDYTWVAPTQNVDGSPLTDLAGFRLYIGSTLVGNELAIIDIPDYQATSYRWSATVVNGTTTYARLTAYNLAGDESAYSNTSIIGPFVENAVSSPDIGVLSGVGRIVSCPVGFVCAIGN